MTPEEILQVVLEQATTAETTLIDKKSERDKIEQVALNTSNRACARLLMACMLAKMDSPSIDPRNPYTEIGGDNSFSGRTYDERYLTKFINGNRLPLNSTTAFLTPTLRNISSPLTADSKLFGGPSYLYKITFELLEEVAENRLSADRVFAETIRVLMKLRTEKLSRIDSLVGALERRDGALPLASEYIVTLIGQHLACKNSSRLPVLIVAAAYETAGEMLAARMLPLMGHNAADSQTGSLGDVEICLVGDDAVVTAYEMKMKRVTRDDIDLAVKKILSSEKRVHNYLFVTTEIIDQEVSDYAAAFYDDLNGTEIAVLDPMDFLRSFVHFFHRFRSEYLDSYQKLVLGEPDSAVGQNLKEAFLSLRLTAESDY